MNTTTIKWTKAAAIATVIFIAFSIYLFLRRGYYNTYIVNKVFGSTSAILAGLTLLIGPLSRKFIKVAPYLAIRRQLGLLALVLGLAHVVVSLFSLPNKFPPAFFLNEWIPMVFGVIAILLWLYLASISTDNKIKQLGGTLWKRQQNVIGRIAFIAVYLHLVVMKYQGWINWLGGKVKVTPELANPGYPPASIFVFLLMSGIILYRIFIFAGAKINK